MCAGLRSVARVWLADCGGPDGLSEGGRDLVLLHESERRRYRAMLRPERRRQFLGGRRLLRRALRETFGPAADGWQTVEIPGRAPRLAGDGARPIRFSLTHSRDRVVCVLAERASVGVDLEYAGRERDFLGIAAQCFHPEQVRRLEALPIEERRAGFYRLWTAYEAALKACGGCERVETGTSDACPGRQGMMVATTLLGAHSLALAVCGDDRLPESLTQYPSDGSGETREPLAWSRHDAVVASFAMK